MTRSLWDEMQAKQAQTDAESPAAERTYDPDYERPTYDEWKRDDDERRENDERRHARFRRY